MLEHCTYNHDTLPCRLATTLSTSTSGHAGIADAETPTCLPLQATTDAHHHSNATTEVCTGQDAECLPGTAVRVCMRARGTRQKKCDASWQRHGIRPAVQCVYARADVWCIYACFPMWHDGHALSMHAHMCKGRSLMMAWLSYCLQAAQLIGDDFLALEKYVNINYLVRDQCPACIHAKRTAC